MSIGTTIKKLRREREITQEQLAEYLGISASAVSQWECDKSCPDVSQLPILANIFNVTTDEILSVNIRNNEIKIEKISTEAQKLFGEGCSDKAEILLNQGLREFPNSYKLMQQISEMLYCKAFRCGQDRDKLLAESLALAEKVIAECDNIEIKAEAIRTASYAYTETGRSSEAEKCAKLLPEITRNDLLTRIYKGSKLAKLYKNEMIQEQITGGLMYAKHLAELRDDDGCELYSDDEKLIIYQKIIDIYKIIYEDEDYDFFSQFLVFANQSMAYIFAKRKNTDEVIFHLEEAATHAIMFETYDPSRKKTSLLFRGLEDGGWVKNEPDENSYVILQLIKDMSDKIYDFVRTDTRFVNIQSKLQQATDRT